MKGYKKLLEGLKELKELPVWQSLLILMLIVLGIVFAISMVLGFSLILYTRAPNLVWNAILMWLASYLSASVVSDHASFREKFNASLAGTIFLVWFTNW